MVFSHLQLFSGRPILYVFAHSTSPPFRPFVNACRVVWDCFNGRCKTCGASRKHSTGRNSQKIVLEAKHVSHHQKLFATHHEQCFIAGTQVPLLGRKSPQVHLNSSIAESEMQNTVSYDMQEQGSVGDQNTPTLPKHEIFAIHRPKYKVGCDLYIILWATNQP